MNEVCRQRHLLPPEKLLCTAEGGIQAHGNPRRRAQSFTPIHLAIGNYIIAMAKYTASYSFTELG